MPAVCKSCGCSDIDTDPARGDAVCTKCGSVVDDHLIVSEVEFEENSAGGANVIGQFVAAEGSNTLSLGQSYKHSLGRDSRQHIYNNGKRMINSLGSQLSLSKHCLESAFMFYKLAVNRRLTQGRKTIHVVGACLYLVCRTEKTPHLLIDVSDVTQTDVFTLGRTFLALSRELCIDVPTTDPSLYIHRFAHQLKFGEKENEVATTALRLVSRMKRDWMSTGRRPSGLCGAALIVASRLHGFNRTVKDVVKVVRLSHSTIMQRLVDFGKTASSKLTVDEFNKIDLEEEADPPSFTKARQRAKQAQIYDESVKYAAPDLLAQLALTQDRVEEVLAKRKIIEDDIANRATVLPSQEERRKILKSGIPIRALNYMQENASDLNRASETAAGPSGNVSLESEAGPSCTITSQSMEANSTLDYNAVGKITEKDVKEKELLDAIALFNESQQDNENEDEGLDNSESYPAGGDAETHEGIKTSDAVRKKEEAQEECPEWELDLEGLDDNELEECLLGEDEIEVKTKLWMEENGEFMEKLKEREERAALEVEAKLKTEGFKKKKTRRKKNKTTADTAEEAIQTMLTERKLSTKINYDVLRDLAAEGGVDIKSIAKSEAKIENEDRKQDLFKTPVVYESGPVEKKLKFRSGFKRTTNLQNINAQAKRTKAEPSSLHTSPSLTTLSVKQEVTEQVAVDSSASFAQSSTEESGKEDLLKPAVIESGPIGIESAVDEVDNEVEYDDEADEEPISASQLLGLGLADEAYDEYGDYQEEFF